MAAVKDSITGLYITYFNRAPDAGGLAYWEAQAAAQGNTAALFGISSAFAQNSVAVTNYPSSLTNTQFVQQVYGYALNRGSAVPNGITSIGPIDAAGQTFWEGRLASGLSRSNMMVEFINAVLDYTGTDANGLQAQQMIRNKVAVGQAFAASNNSNVVLDNAGNPDTASAVYQASLSVMNGVTGTLTTAEQQAKVAAATSTVNALAPSAYSVFAQQTSANEGANATFKLNTTNVANGTVVNYTLSGNGITAADVTGGLTGSVTVNNNTATISVALAADQATEGNETISVAINGQSLQSASTPTTVITDTSITPAGNQFTLTTNIDNIPGTNGNDVIIGDFGVTGQLSAADQLNGSGGADILQLYGTYDVTKMPINIANIETLNFVNPGVNAIIDTSGIAGLTKLQIDQVSGTGTTAYTTGAGTTLQLQSLNGAVQTGVTTWNAAASDNTSNLILNGFQGVAGGTEAAVTVTGAATTTLNIASQGTTPAGSTAANQISTLTAPATTTKVAVTGAAGLEISTSLTGAAINNVDASANTGGVNINVNGTNPTLRFTGGTGNDTVTFGTTNIFSSADTVSGGDGNDILEVRAAQAIGTSTPFTNISGFETLKITDATSAGNAINLSHFGGIQNIAFGAAATATTTVSGINSGATVSLATTSGLALSVQNNTSNDTLNIKTSGGAVTYTVDASQVENLNLDTSGVTGNTTFAFTDAQLKSVVLANTTATNTNPDFSVNLGTLGVVTSNVNVSAFKAATATNGVTVALSGSAVNGATVTGSANNDTITGSSQGDSITSGNGADTVTPGAGADTVDLAESLASIDNVIFGTAAANGVDTIRSFAVGAGVDTITLTNADTTPAGGGAAAVLGASTAALVTAGGAFVPGASTTTSDVIEINTTLDATVTLSASSTGADFLQALSADTTAASGITATTAADKLFFVAYQNNNAYLFYGDSGAADTTIAASEISLVGVFENIAAGAFAAGDILMGA